MSGADELISLLTDKLAPDPELQRDVANELRSHLEDCAAEFRQAGQGDEQAAASAAKALGDPRELSDQLWQANRGRMRLRGVLRWAASIALLPAAIAVVVMLVVGHGLTFRFDARTSYDSWARERLTNDQAFILFGDPRTDDPLEAAKSISDRWPDNPVYYGNYAVRLLNTLESDDEPKGSKTAEALAALDKGERIDPGNSYYNYSKASWLMRHSSTLTDDPKNTYETRDAKGKVTTHPLSTITISDPAMFQRGLDEFRRGVAKPFFASRTIDLAKERIALMPPPESLLDFMRKINLGAYTILPDLQGLIRVSRHVSAYAISQAKTGGPEAVKLARSVTVMADNIGKDDLTLIELLVASSIRAIALDGESAVYAEMGQQALSEKARRELHEHRDFIANIRSRPKLDPAQKNHTGMLWSVLTPSLPGLRVNFAPIRTAEIWAMTQLALMILLALLVLVAVVVSVLSWAVNRRENRPMLLFVGWRQIARICLLSIVLPLGAYGLYAYAVTAPQDAYGLNCSAGRVYMEFTVVVSVVCALLLRLSYSAVRKRCEELGLEVPQPRPLRKRWILASLASLLVLAVIGYEICWWSWIPTAAPREWPGPWVEFAEMSASPSSAFAIPSPEGAMLGGIVVVFTGACILVGFARLLRKRLGLFRRTLFRSLSPILSAAVILVALACGYALTRAESSAARQISGDAAMGFTNEIEKSDYRLLREQFGTWQAQDDAD